MTILPERILMTADAVGGVWTYALELARQFTRQGSEVRLVVLGPVPDEAQRLEASLIRGMTVIELPGRLEWMAQPEKDLEIHARALKKIARDFRPGVAHLNGYAQAASGFSCPSAVVAHSCVWSWWRSVEGEDPPEEWDSYRRRVRRGLAGADLVLAPSRALLEEVRAIFRPTTPGLAIPNGRSWSNPPLVAKAPLILAAGRFWDKAKNLAALCAVSGDLPWPVYLAGPLVKEDEARPYLGAARPLGVLTAQEMRDWMARAAIFAAPARYEPFGLAILEAAQSGAALVLGDLPSLREIWGEAALFVPPNDLGALRSAIMSLIRDERHRDALSRLARERAGLHSASAMAMATGRAYRLAAEHHATRLAR